MWKERTGFCENTALRTYNTFRITRITKEAMCWSLVLLSVGVSFSWMDFLWEYSFFKTRSKLGIATHTLPLSCVSVTFGGTHFIHIDDKICVLWNDIRKRVREKEEKKREKTSFVHSFIYSFVPSFVHLEFCIWEFSVWKKGRKFEENYSAWFNFNHFDIWVKT